MLKICEGTYWTSSKELNGAKCGKANSIILGGGECTMLFIMEICSAGLGADSEHVLLLKEAKKYNKHSAGSLENYNIKSKSYLI